MNFKGLHLLIQKKNQINNKTLKKIFSLKKEHYSYSILSQKKWFEENIKSKDLNILFFLNKNLIGYNVLRDINIRFLKKKINYLLFDTLIIKKKFRGKGYSKFIMNISMTILTNSNKKSFLFCEKLMIPFYENYGWKVITREKGKKILKNSQFTLHLNKKFMLFYKR